MTAGGFARSTCAGSLAIVAAVYLAGLVWMPDGGFWINDNGLKFIQLQGILRNGFESFAIDWPGFAIDPSYDFGPIAKPFMHFAERELYISYSPVFALVSALPVRLFGPIGLLLLPLAAGLMALPAVRRLAQLASGDATARVGSVAVLLAGLATPLCFYSQTFWEHTPALALSCWSFVACLRYREQPTRRRAVATAVLAALPIYFRTDAYLLALVVLAFAGVAATRPLRAFAMLGVVCAAALIPLWAFHWLALGDPLGFHLQSQMWSEISLAEYLTGRGEAANNLLFRGHGNGWWSLAAVAPFVLCALFAPRLREARLQRVAPAAVAAALASGVVVLTGHLLAQRPMSWLMLSNGLFAASPICILAFLPPAGELHSRLPGSPQQMRKALLGIAVAYAGLYTLFVPVLNTTGVHWGSRFLLPVYPVLAALASVSLVAWWERWKVGSALPRVLIAALVTLSFGLQLYSLALLSARKQFSQRLNAEVARDAAEIVITDTWFLPADLAHSFYEKPIFLARRASDRRRLEAAAGSAGVERALLVERLRRGPAAPGGRVLSDGWLNFSSVVLRERVLTADGPG